MSLTAMGQARGWNGLVPLHSTRADVERLLGAPTDVLSRNMTFYRNANETVIITYATGAPCGIGDRYSQWRVPANTVESILVTPVKELPVSQLSLDESKFEKASGGHTSEDVYYVNDQDGISIRVYLGAVMSMSFYPGRIDAGLRCSGAQPAKRDCTGFTPPAFDSFRKLSRSEEIMHLDRFGAELLGDRTQKGFIISYAGKRAIIGEAKEWAERAKTYLLNVRGVPASQIAVIDGGYRAARRMELYVVESNGCPPPSNPSVDPRDVQIIKRTKAANTRRSSKP